jgi:hypothetical protein
MNTDNILRIIKQYCDIEFTKIQKLNSYRPLSIECLFKGIPIVEYNSIVMKDFELLAENLLNNEKVGNNLAGQDTQSTTYSLTNLDTSPVETEKSPVTINNRISESSNEDAANRRSKKRFIYKMRS